MSASVDQIRLELAGAALLCGQGRLSEEDALGLQERLRADLEESGDGMVLIWRQALLTAALAENLAEAWGIEPADLLASLGGVGD